LKLCQSLIDYLANEDEDEEQDGDEDEENQDA